MRTIKIALTDLVKSPDVQVTTFYDTWLEEIRGWIEFRNRQCQEANVASSTLVDNKGSLEFWFEWNLDAYGTGNDEDRKMQVFCKALNNHDVPFRVE